MGKVIRTLGLLALTCICSPLAHAAVIVNFSPDATGASVLFSNFTDSVGQGQIIGDQFTLTSDVLLTGGSIYSDSTQGPLGTSVRFLIYSNPTAAPVVDITTTVDTVDSAGTTTQSILTRKHASISSTFLAAGTYWFSMPSANNTNFTQGTGNYSNNSFRQGTIGAGLTSSASGLGDAFFQLEGIAVPEPGSVALLSLGLGALVLCYRMRFRATVS